MGPARGSGWTIKVKGDPDVELNLDIGEMERGRGSRLTVAGVINDIPIIVEAKPGPLSYLDSIIPRGWNRVGRT